MPIINNAEKRRRAAVARRNATELNFFVRQASRIETAKTAVPENPQPADPPKSK